MSWSRLKKAFRTILWTLANRDSPDQNRYDDTMLAVF
jgi:hypothetical protein